jgi:hypothetical protein
VPLIAAGRSVVVTIGVIPSVTVPKWLQNGCQIFIDVQTMPNEMRFGAVGDKACVAGDKATVEMGCAP